MGQPILPIPGPGAPAPEPRRIPRWVELVIFCAVAAGFYGMLRAATQLAGRMPSGERIDLSIYKLPLYAAYSTMRMGVAYIISLVFSLVYAKVAAGNRVAERFLLPLLDILQSIPILTFMPGVVPGLAALFPGRAIGLELAIVILIFTSQAWNLAFSFHQSLLTIPRELREAAAIYRLGAWGRFTRLELPFGMISLIANSMMSWAGGWFFLTAAEAFTLGPNRSFRVPGIGSYLAGAADEGNGFALALGLVTLIIVIILLDQVLWRPLVAWSDRFKIEQSGAGDVPQSVVFDLLQNSELISTFSQRVLRPLSFTLDRWLRRLPTRMRPAAGSPPPAPDTAAKARRGRIIGWGIVAVLLGLILWGAVATVGELIGLPGKDWAAIWLGAGATFGRTLVALLLAAAWTIPVGVAIGLNPRWAHRAQPIVQVVASVPATAIFPVLVLALINLPGGLNIGAVLLMLLGTQWYVLFNVIAGAMAIPSDLREAATNYHVSGWRRWRTLILPAIFPYLVTGMITATGGAWNASIVSEFVTVKNQTYSTLGLGSLITTAETNGNFPLLLAGTVVMAAIVIVANRLVWRRLYALAESRYRLE